MSRATSFGTTTCLRTITDDDPDLMRFHQEAAGMALVGRVYCENLMIALGGGRNGKQKLLLSQVLGHAALTDVILRSPMQVVPMPPMTHNTKAVCPYEKDDQERFVAAFTEEKNGRLRFRYGWGCVPILETGLRAGEALALEWGDIDEEKRTPKVNKNLVRFDGKNTVQRTTKTASGKGTIPLNSRALEAIQHLKAQQVAGCPYVFATQTGKHLSYRNLLATMEKACEAMGVEHRGLHALRHSFASNLYARGVEVKIILKLLGHASVEITYNRYIHSWRYR